MLRSISKWQGGVEQSRIFWTACVDGMPVRELYKYLTNNRERIESELRQGEYLPQAILGVEIPKSNGKTRLLGIPTVIDRLLQQAVGQVIAIKFEMEFEDYSYGFRPNRNAQQAVLKAQEYIITGEAVYSICNRSYFSVSLFFNISINSSSSSVSK